MVGRGAKLRAWSVDASWTWSGSHGAIAMVARARSGIGMALGAVPGGRGTRAVGGGLCGKWSCMAEQWIGRESRARREG